MSMNRRSFLEITAACGLGLLFGGAKPAGKAWSDRGVRLTIVRRSSLVMGSVISFEVVSEKKEDGYEAIRRAVAVFRDLDRKLSMYDPESETGKLAQHAGRKPVSVSEDTLRVLRFAKEMWSETHGKFDVTIEPAMQQWGFRKDAGEVVQRPDDEELKRLEKLIGSEKLVLFSDKAYLEKPGMAVDLGGIAGGYALDKAVEEIKQADIAAAFINFSGDIHCFGKPVDGNGWPVYILNPHTGEPSDKPIELKDEALSTSGAYQNRRKSANNDSWGHLLLPGSAAPIELKGSVTAIHHSAMIADAWSTAGFVGAEKPGDIRWLSAWNPAHRTVIKIH